MKTFNHILLGFAFYLTGCTSFYPLTNEERGEGRPTADESLLVRLKDGRSIEVEPYRHTSVSEPSDFIFGEGVNKHTSRKFRGGLLKSVIDSSGSEEGSLICWLHNGTPIVFKGNDYVEVKSDEGAGFWCVGEYQDGELFRGRVDDKDILEIRVGRDALTPLYVGAAVGGVGGVVLGASDIARWSGASEGEQILVLGLIGVGIGVGIGGLVVLGQLE